MRRPRLPLEEIRQGNDIFDVISERIQLRKAGKDYDACCPFHDEQTPSFTVSREKQFYHCFGCGEHGDVFDFLETYEGLSFVDAVKLLAHRAGISLEHDDLNPEASKSPMSEVAEGESLVAQEYAQPELLVLAMALTRDWSGDEYEKHRRCAALACRRLLQALLVIYRWNLSKPDSIEFTRQHLSAEVLILYRAMRGRCVERSDGARLRAMMPWRIPFPLEIYPRELMAARFVYETLQELEQDGLLKESKRARQKK